MLLINNHSRLLKQIFVFLNLYLINPLTYGVTLPPVSNNQAGLTETQNIMYDSRDRYGNALTQTIDAYDSTNNLIDHKNITNHFDPNNKPAEMKGNATSTDVKRWSTTDETTSMIEETITNTLSFDSFGNALVQQSDNYVAGLLAKRTDIVNSGIDARGDAGLQTITTSQTDALGANLEVTSYQVMTRRSFDTSHNVTDQLILTYSDSTMKDLKDVQEIRSSGFTSSGVASSPAKIASLPLFCKSNVSCI